MRMLKIARIFPFLFLFSVGFSQTPYQDSLYDLLLDKQHDSTRAIILNEIAVSYHDENDYIAIKEANRAIEFARKSKNLNQECVAYFHIGTAHVNTNRFSDALNYYFKSLRVAEEMGSQKMILQNYNQIGIIYSYQGNSKQAYKYFKKFLDVSLKGDNKLNIARGYNNIGISLKNEGNFEEAKTNYQKALKIFEELEFTRGLISCLSNIGVVSMELKQMDTAAVYFANAKKLAETQEDKFSLAITFINIGELNLKTKKFNQAIEYYQKALAISKDQDMLQQLRDANLGMYQCYEQMGNYENAFIFHREYLKLRDSIANDETNGKLNQAEQNYEELKLEKIRQEEEQKNQLQKAEDKRLLAEERAFNEETKKYIWVLILVSLSVTILIIILFLRYKEKNKSNRILKEQRDEIAHSKKEITDSINYALRIQQAVLPEKESLRPYFSDYFILYQPKDIVSGDFYWFNESNGRLILTAADCTGHGVPGGFMSMIGTDKLNHAVFEKGETDPSRILSIISEGVKKALKQDDSENASRDGMDMSILSMVVDDLKNKDKSNIQAEWSGANRPIWIIRGNECMEIKPTKTAVGGFTSDSSTFSKHALDLKRGDAIYLFSDGFADQFGGTDEKKMTTRKFKEKLLSIQGLNMQDQERELLRYFHQWRGALDQIDDVLVIGIRL